MKARASVVAEPDGRDGTRLTSLRSEAPLALRPTPEGVYLVGTAAGPLGGDKLTLDIHVESGASLTMRSAAASLAFPGPSPSVVEINARVSEGASLEWLVEPLVAVQGCQHEVRARLDVQMGGRLHWREELVLGRHGEEGGSVISLMSLDVDGRPVMRHALALGGEGTHWDSCAVGGGARAAGSFLIVDPSWEDIGPAPALIDRGCALLPLVGPAAQVTAVAPSALALRALLAAGRARAHPQTQEAGKDFERNTTGNAHATGMFA